jgi:hypothetical protein
LYPDDADLIPCLRARLVDLRPAPPDLREHVAQFDWRAMAPRYDGVLSEITR